jgi:hypothetical protein
MILNKTTSTKIFLATVLVVGLWFAKAPVVKAQVDLGLNFAGQIGLSDQDPRVTVAKVIRIGLGFLGIIAVCLLLYAGFLWMNSGGNEEKIATAKKLLINATIGLAIILSAFGIASFIITRLLSATGGSGGGGGGGVCNPSCIAGEVCCSGVCVFGTSCSIFGSTPFTVRNTIPVNRMEGLPRNTVITYKFNEPIRAASVTDATFTVVDTTNTPIPGTRTINGKYIEFVPDSLCPPPNATLHCLPSMTNISVKAVNGNIISNSGKNLDCTGAPCSISFTTGNYVDIDKPRINIVSEQVCVAPNNTLSGSAIDDYGLRLMDFYVEGSLVGSELNEPPPLSPFNASAIWNGEAFTVGQNIELKATVYDFASNQASAQKRVRVSAGHCCNGIQDGDEEAIDCGGSCLACNGQACAMDRTDPDGQCSDELCSSNSCSATGSTQLSCEDAGFPLGTQNCCLCQTKPRIDSITPLGGFCSNDFDISCTVETVNDDCGEGNSCDVGTPNGSAGNFITISGSGFGTDRGKVFFTGIDGTEVRAALADDTTLGNARCGTNVWTNKQIIAVVPAGAIDGGITVESASQTRDRSDDLYGPMINIFKKNSIDRPGLCEIDPDSGKQGDVINYFGVKLNLSEAYFGNLLSHVTATDSTFVQPKEGTAKVPNLQTGKTTTYVLKSGVYSNFLDFTKKAEPFVGPEIGSIEPARGPIGQYVTIRGSGFGSSKGNSKIRFGDVTGPEADYDFPQVCAESVWSDRQIIVKVPNPIPLGDYVITLEKAGSAPVNSGTQTFEVTAGSPDPGVCRIDPSLGQRNSTVTFWGEYFKTKDRNSAVRFYNNQVQSEDNITFWEIDRSGTWKVVTTVPQNANSGPVRIEAGSPTQVSNSLNFSVGLCTRNEDCGGTETCCAAGLPEAGRCKANASECYGSVATSVYEWQFSTGYATLSCGADQTQCGTVCCAGGCDELVPNKCAKCRVAGQHRCGDGKCCTNPCIPDNNGNTTCVASCSGYTYNQCIEGYFCPNSPGKCSPSGGTGEPIATGQICGNVACEALPGCENNTCEYNQSLNRCVKTTTLTSSCKAKDLKDNPRPPETPKIIRINNNPDGDPVEGYCALFNDEGPRWHISWQISCPAGWVKGSGDFCIDKNSINGPCSICGNNQTCLMNGDRGVCAVGNAVCSTGSTCDLRDNKCKKIDTGTCECCCRIDNAQEDCCDGLLCDGSCGSGPRLGFCSGCVVGEDQEVNDAKCNCAKSQGKICDASVDPRGRCVDCESITDPAECSKHGACCVDGRTSANKCVGLAESQEIVTETIGGEPVNFCGFYKCTGVYPNSCDDSPYKIGAYQTRDTCDLSCVEAPIPCSNSGSCNNSSPACAEGFICSDSSCTCVRESEGEAGQSCVDPNNEPLCLLTGGCRTGYNCLDDTPNDPVCRCCCKPPSGGEPDSCKDINPNLSCLANQGLCSGGERGLCCGCSKDSECGDPLTVGCGTTGARCCSARPTVEQHLPAIGATNVCRNAAIEAVFDQKMDIASFSEDRNVQIIGDYGNGDCPSGYPIVASSPPTGRLANFLHPIKKVLVKIAPFLLSRPAFADFSNFCIVNGSPIGSEVANMKSKMSFRLTRPLDSGITYYVVLKGDPALGVGNIRPKDFYNEHITSISNVGMVGVVRGTRIPNIFNNTEFKNAEIWKFTASTEICSLDSVQVSPNFHLFQKTGQEIYLNAAAKNRNGQTIQPIPTVYNWDWGWNSENNNIAQVVEQGDPTVALATAGNAKDAQTLGKATSTITVDTIGSTTGKVVAGVSRLRLFLCENPWPVYFALPGYPWPWKDDTTGIEFYYCRDKQGIGTSDDLPALQEDPLIGPTSRRICMSGTNSGKSCRTDRDCTNIVGSCLPEVLKEFFFFREQVADVPTITGTVDAIGGQVTLSWNATRLAAKYKVYYGLRPGHYTSNVEATGTGTTVTKTISGLVNGLSYYFAVTALTDKNQETVLSNELKLRPTDTTPPAPPRILGSGADRRITLFWDQVPEATSYMAYLGVDAPPSTNYPISQPVRTVPGPNQPNTTFTGLDNNGTYYLVVKSVDLYGNASPYSSSVTVKPNDPYLISAVVERGDGRTGVRLKWLPFIGAQGYTIKYNYEGSNLPPQTIEVGSSLLNYKVQNLIIGENYEFKIIAKKANNQMSNESNSISTIFR